eukprot:CAMPEP_0182495386 /NCGR_PEP_ID=MMETSP1321-20130603/4179_1 /TAXON_ID=91990 /ORGANISM="Bolidomonas sp., Strain RCC1657" /LENGTH=206 /DNA_ID=CAMNT_0024698757 /DNA_START=74 /DNA_END=694 /DNA_ORIENTATION=-
MVALLLLSLLTSANSFAFHPVSPMVSPKVSPFSLSSAVYSSSDSSAPDPIYAKVGFSEDAMAKGLDPKMVLDKLGTRDDLVAKFLKDNKKFDQERAEEEVDRFMMDREMVEKYIAWEIKKAEPDFQKNARDEAFSDPSVIGLYAAWLVGGAGIAYFKNVIAGPKFASGEWEPIKIHIPEWVPGQDPAAHGEAVVGVFNEHANHFFG